MFKAILGLAFLVALAVIIGTNSHWGIGFIVVALPVLIVYVKLKRNPTYRARCDSELGKAFER